MKPSIATANNRTNLRQHVVNTPATAIKKAAPVYNVGKVFLRLALGSYPDAIHVRTEHVMFVLITFQPLALSYYCLSFRPCDGVFSVIPETTWGSLVIMEARSSCFCRRLLKDLREAA